MTEPGKPSTSWGGGAPLALLTIAGPIVAGLLGYSPSMGLLVGFALGVLAAIAIWLKGPR